MDNLKLKKQHKYLAPKKMKLYGREREQADRKMLYKEKGGHVWLLEVKNAVTSERSLKAEYGFLRFALTVIFSAKIFLNMINQSCVFAMIA